MHTGGSPPPGGRDGFTVMRVRASMEAKPDSRLSVFVESTLQRGRRAGEPVSAHLLAAWVGRSFANGRAHLAL